MNCVSLKKTRGLLTTLNIVIAVHSKCIFTPIEYKSFSFTPSENTGTANMQAYGRSSTLFFITNMCVRPYELISNFTSAFPRGIQFIVENQKQKKKFKVNPNVHLYVRFASSQFARSYREYIKAHTSHNIIWCIIYVRMSWSVLFSLVSIEIKY